MVVQRRRGSGGVTPAVPPTLQGLTPEQRRVYSGRSAQSIPASTPAQISAASRQAPRDAYTATAPPPPAPPSGGGGGGTGGGGGGIAAQPAPMSLQDFIQSNYLYQQRQNENSRQEQDFDSGYLRDEQLLRGDQERKRFDLQTQMDEAGVNAANDYAGRGLLRSGGIFQEQDKIDAQGEQAGSLIDQLLSDFVTRKQNERLQLQSQGRGALDSVIAKLTDQFSGAQSI